MVLIVFLLLGMAAGVLSGLFGIGGGLIIVPILVYVFTLQGVSVDVLTHLAVGTSLATIVFTSINSVLAHHRLGAVQWRTVLWLSFGILFGSALGGYTASFMSGALLQKVIGVFAILMAIQMFFQLQPKHQAGSDPGRGFLGVSGVLIGWASAIFGIGGGSLTVPLLSWKGVPMRLAVGTSAACGLPIALSGSLSFIWFGLQAEALPEWSLGYVYLPALLGIAVTSMVFARFGAQLAHWLDPLLLKRLFALLLFLVGLSFLY
ncbi:sulfite exporter TauE/SafE family protein [Nitrincola sp.]|uniref:sulfite exporter TauE/SafE family protein n=1 Tax=Nitrincola sp. TaxID=1926584 RepID=UPI003A90DD68